VKFKIVGISLVLSTILFAGGCVSSRDSANGPMGNLLLAEPEPINARSQMAIARYNHILTQAPLKDDERAELLFQRGMLYDSVGLAGLFTIFSRWTSYKHTNLSIQP
jgi:lipoprotein NlpI